MKLLRTLVIALCASSFSHFTLADATKNASQSSSIDKALEINVGDREMMVDENGQALSQFKYVIKNIGTKPIANVQWVSVYLSERQVAYSQDMQIELDNLLMPGKSVTLNVQIPFVQIPEKFRPIFINTKDKIDVYKLARVVQFNDKKTFSD